MSTIKTQDGTTIFYKDWGPATGIPLVFSHGWPLNSDAWDEQLLYFGAAGFRVIAHDRRGHGRSGATWDKNEMNTYADDLAALLDKLDVTRAVLIGHSTGGGEVTRYLGRFGPKRVAKLVLVGAVPPLLLKGDGNPSGVPMQLFDQLRTSLATNHSQFWREFAPSFFGANRPGASVPQGVLDQFWLQSMQASLRGAYECIKAFSETDFTKDLQSITVPTLFIHGDDDQVVPIAVAARNATKLVKGSRLIEYAGAPHGLMTTHRDRFHSDLMAFIKG